jgi:hypothetical protein
MRTGTEHFVSERAARRYYRQQTGSGRIADKIKDGSIKIGPPTIKRGETLGIIKDEGRFEIIS